MRLRHLLSATCLCLGVAAPACAADAAPVPTKDQVEAVINQAQTWLASKQLDTGAFAKDQFALGISALATDALARSPDALPVDGPVMTKSLTYILGNVQPDGGIYLKEQGLGTYCTALTLMVLKETGQLDAHKDLVKAAQEYLFGAQIKDGPNAGGIGYDQEDGPTHQDIPNTSIAITGLAASGIPASDPHMQAALHFLEHCQNLSSVNPAKWVDNDPKGSMGSAAYSPNESNSNGSFPEKQDVDNPTKKLLGTGSMTYSLISDYIMLDLKAGDPRLDTALDWCKRNYRFDANPGMIAGKEHEGLLYYFMMMGKTMHALGIKTLTLADGTTVDWRADLFKAIVDHGHVVPVGSEKGMIFMNDAQRWGEGFPHLATSYMIASLKDIDASLSP